MKGRLERECILVYVFWPAMAEMAEKKEKLENLVKAKSGREDVVLVPVITENWNDDLSPWEFKDKRNFFAGKAELFLEKVLEKAKGGEFLVQDRMILAGYSLAGLFSLWAAARTDIFDGVASCSGSLWFPGFLEADLRPQCRRVYLSLGDKEAKTKHPLMSLVQDVTGKYAEELQASGKYDSVVFELNPGNHFVDSMERLAKGIVYLLKD